MHNFYYEVTVSCCLCVAHQAAIISRKKEGAAEALQDAREEYHKLESETEEKRAQLKESTGGEVLKGEDVSMVCFPAVAEENVQLQFVIM